MGPPGRAIRKAVEYPESEFARIEKAMDFGVILTVVKFKSCGHGCLCIRGRGKKGTWSKMTMRGMEAIQGLKWGGQGGERRQGLWVTAEVSTVKGFQEEE